MSSDEAFRTALGRTEERWSAQLDRLFERFEKSVDRLEAKIDQRMDATALNVQSEFTEAKAAAGELRDGIAMLRDRVSELEKNRATNLRASAEGAAKGAGEAAGAVATRAAEVIANRPQTQWWSTLPGKWVAGAVGFTAVVEAIRNIPSIVRTIGVFIHFVSGLGT